MKKNILYKLIIFSILIILPMTLLSPATSYAEESQSDLVAQVEILKAAAEEYRGLEFLYDVPVELLSQNEAAELIEDLIDQEITSEINTAFTDLYILLGLMPHGSDFIGSYKEMTEEQVAGLYDPAVKKFYVVDIDMNDMYSSMLGSFGNIPGLDALLGMFIEALYPGIGDLFGETIIVHELTHALDDQHYDIESNTERLQDLSSDDAQLAYQSLLEGSATLAMNRYQLDSLSEYGLDSDLLSGSMSMDVAVVAGMIDYDPFIERIALHPYLDGEAFLRVAFEENGTDGINSVFENPPTTMEQILHPERYYDELDTPSTADEIDLTEILDDWEVEAVDSLGELLTSLVIEFNTGDIVNARTVGAGWDYDIITSWRSPDDDLAFSWLTVWDTDNDADEFFTSYRTLLEMKHPSGTWIENTDTILKYTGLGLAAIVEQRGRVVVVIEGVPEDKADECLEEAWNSNITYY